MSSAACGYRGNKGPRIRWRPASYDIFPGTDWFRVLFLSKKVKKIKIISTQLLTVLKKRAMIIPERRKGSPPEGAGFLFTVPRNEKTCVKAVIFDWRNDLCYRVFLEKICLMISLTEVPIYLAAEP